MGTLLHADLERLVLDSLGKTEPPAPGVLAAGWMLKQGEGGLFHGDAFKLRYFMLARVPHATLLIYYAQAHIDDAGILGYIDLRTVSIVREVMRTVSVDPGKVKTTVKKGSSGSPRRVIELVTPSRTYSLIPITITMPPLLSNTKALMTEHCARPLYLFDWPFPVPHVVEALTSTAAWSAWYEDRTIDKPADNWLHTLTNAVSHELATRSYAVDTVLDSTSQLPPKLTLRVTPTLLVLVSATAPDAAYAAFSYQDLLKWGLQKGSPNEVQTMVRTRARLISTASRTWFQLQRPSHSTCNFVFRIAGSGTEVVDLIDGFVRDVAMKAGFGGALDAAPSAAALSTASLAAALPEAASHSATAGSPSAGAGCTPAAGAADAATGLDDDAEEEPEEKVTKRDLAKRLTRRSMVRPVGFEAADDE